MKYIRTKDGIYSYKPTHNIDVDGFVVQHNLTGWDKPIMKEDIIKITDTIEELCDEFVFVDSIGSFLISIDWYVEEQKVEKAIVEFECMTLSRPLKNCLKQGIIYGAIWTEWGLKYVAKMNEKGEMELL